MKKTREKKLKRRQGSGLHDITNKDSSSREIKLKSKRKVSKVKAVVRHHKVSSRPSTSSSSEIPDEKHRHGSSLKPGPSTCVAPPSPTSSLPSAAEESTAESVFQRRHASRRLKGGRSPMKTVPDKKESKGNRKMKKRDPRTKNVAKKGSRRAGRSGSASSYAALTGRKRMAHIESELKQANEESASLRDRNMFLEQEYVDVLMIMCRCYCMQFIIVTVFKFVVVVRYCHCMLASNCYLHVLTVVVTEIRWRFLLSISHFLLPLFFPL